MTPLEKAFFDAINVGDLARIQQCINSRVNVNGRNDELFTPLHRAAYLLEKDIDGQDRYKNIINELLNAGADPILLLDDVKSGFNVLQSVIYRGSRLYDDGKVREAWLYFNVAADLLQRFKTHPDFVNSLNKLLTPDRGKLVKVSHTLLHMAVYFGWSRMVDKLLEYQADVRVTNGNGLTALHLAVLMWIHDDKSERSEIAEKLLNYQANQAAQLINQPWSGKWYPESDKVSVLKALARKGITTYKVEGNGDTVLHTAVASKHKPSVVMLLKHKADTSVLNAARKTAEQIARENKDAQIVGCFDDAKFERMPVSAPFAVQQHNVVSQTLATNSGVYQPLPIGPNVASINDSTTFIQNTVPDVISQTAVNPPPPPPLPPARAQLTVKAEIKPDPAPTNRIKQYSKQIIPVEASQKNKDGRNALLNAITKFNPEQLKKTPAGEAVEEGVQKSVSSLNEILAREMEKRRVAINGKNGNNSEKSKSDFDDDDNNNIDASFLGRTHTVAH